MKSIEKTKEAIAKEVRGKVMAWRIRGKAEAMVGRLESEFKRECPHSETLDNKATFCYNSTSKIAH